MANEPNMKVTYTSDSSKFVQGTRQAKAAVKDFQATTDSALEEIGNAFGVNTGKVGQMTSAIQGMGQKMSASSNESVRALGNMIASLDKVKLAVAGLGIGAAIAAFKSLNSVAEAFKNTVQGANIEMMTAAYVDTYRQAFYDMNSAQGQTFANFMANVKKAGAAAGAVFGSLLVNQGQKTSTALFGLADPTFWKDTIGSMKSANEKATEAEEIAGRIYELQRLRSDKAVEIANTENRISELKNIIWDKSNSEVERANALKEVQDLIRQKYTEQYDIESEIADLMEQQNSLTSSTPAQIDAANQQRIKANSLVSQMNGELKGLLRQQNSLTGSVKATTIALGEEAEAMLKVIQAQQIQEIANRPEFQNLGVSGISLPTGATTEQSTNLAGDLGKVQEVKRAIIDIKSELSGLAAEGASAIGSLIGDLINGENAWANFGNAALEALADMAVAVGKTILQEGIAVEAAKLALTTMSGVGAIAAGAALIAIGSALKTSLKNAANGSYSASSSVASSSYRGSGSAGVGGYDQRELRVTGVLKASGSTLLAVIDSEENRRSHTT